MSPWRQACLQIWRNHPRWTALLLVALGLVSLLAWRNARAGHAWRQAERLTARRDLDEAQIWIDACLDFRPSAPAVHLLAARIARLRQLPDDAYRRLDQAKKLGGNAERIVLERYLLQAGRGEADEVEPKLLAFLHKEDADAIFIYDALTTYEWMLTHRPGDALPRLNAWLRLQPDISEAWVRRAWVQERLRDYPAALADYQVALDLDPDGDRRQGDRVRHRLAELLLERLRLPEALAHFEVLAARPARPADAVLGLARCRLLLGQSDEGWRLLDDLLAEQPDNAKALSEAGRALLEARQTAAAEVRLRRALALQPFDKQTVATLQQCLQQLGKAEEARELDGRLERIRADERQMAEMMTSVQHSPGDPVLRRRIGELFLRNGMEKDGLEWLHSALRYDARHIPAHEALAEWWESRGQRDKAAPHRDMLTKLGAPAKTTNRYLDKK